MRSTEFIQAASSSGDAVLNIGELWAVPIMMRLVLVENLSADSPRA